MSIVYIYELDISLYFYVSFSSSIKLKPTINFMGNFKYNLFFVCAVILLCALEKCFPYSVFKELTLQKKKSYFDRTECCVNSSKSGTTEIPEAPLLLMS